ncbi:hypothetical protein GCM10022408_34790 [Hymenobacter fastidiosus]|uniref:Uncharacterized protein n=1 Tax=Hymenobacter fastidiosus TaxID=486264 RepID=A0ABP7SXU4_9BACT
MQLATGRVQAQAPRHAPGAASPGRADTAAVYMYRRADAAPDKPLTLLAGGRVVGTLLPNGSLAVRWHYRRRDLALCVQGNANTCFSFVSRWRKSFCIKKHVMLSLSKHLYRTLNQSFNDSLEMLRQAQHDVPNRSN